AEHLDEGRFHVAAAVITGGVLEEHLRKLCAKHGIALQPKATINPMNVELAKKNVYGLNDQQQITAWAATRNEAAHLHPNNFTPQQVDLMIAGIRHFISCNPA